MSRIQGFVSPLEKKTIKEIVTLIKMKYPGLTQEAIAVSIGYDRTALSKKEVSGEAQIKALLIYRYLLNKTSPESEDTRDVSNAGNNREDVMSLLREIKSGQDILLANFSKVLKIDAQVPEQPSDKSPQGDLVKKALEKLDDLKSDLEDK